MFKCSKCGGEDQNSDGSCARCSSASLREKLKALVEDMRERGGSPEADRYVRLNLYWYADQLTALLAESEPDIPTEPCEQFKPCAMSGKRGHPAELCGSTCETCGFAADRHEAKAKLPLPLGHEFVPHTNGPERDCTLYQKCHYIGGPGLCGQPRSAHEPRRGRLGR